MNQQTTREIFNDIEDLIVRGQIRQAGLLLDAKKPSASTRLETLKLANLHRRVGHADQALRLLAPTVRTELASVEATDQEKAEYAISLMRVGSVMEATHLLATINVENSPEALMYKAITHFSEWNYRDGIAHLEKMLRVSNIPQFTRHLGQLNLAAALVHLDRIECEDVLEELRSQTLDAGELLLHANALEISAQRAIKKGDFAAAEKFLQSGLRLIEGVKILDFLWVIKWKGILEALKKNSVEPLNAVREEAILKGHWETLREVDFHKLQIHFSASDFYRLYFGTRSVHYRERLETAFPTVEIPEFYYLEKDRRVSFAPSSSVDIFNDFSGSLSAGTVQNALLVHFISDAYRSFRTGELFSIVFPEEWYNPDTSPNKVHQTLSRFRKIIQEQLPGVEIEAVDSAYRLNVSSATLALRLPRQLPKADGLQIRFWQFENLHKQKEFTNRDVQDKLNMSKANANRLLAQWVMDGVVKLETRGKIRFYTKA